ncbi:hypothetical protein M0R45_015699 [Rubus argutus]|uniref:Uncharacterized protein n=1 Tax=Rubus argutus TaxID=59490 RepID=A0AAW1XRD2_RUBAR
MDIPNPTRLRPKKSTPPNAFSARTPTPHRVTALTSATSSARTISCGPTTSPLNPINHHNNHNHSTPPSSTSSTPRHPPQGLFSAGELRHPRRSSRERKRHLPIRGITRISTTRPRARRPRRPRHPMRS